MNEIIELLKSDKKVVVLTGAGISTLSGIPDFRGENGLYTKNEEIEYKLSRGYYDYDRLGFYEFYKNTMMIEGYEPNIIHEVLAKLEENGNIIGVITQNIDGLHQKAGSNVVYEIHGNAHKFVCDECNREYTPEHYKEKGVNCECENCMGTIRPGIALYGEDPVWDEYKAARNLLRTADALLILGSTLMVRSTIMLIESFQYRQRLLGKNGLYIANNQETQFDYELEAKRYSGDLGELFEEIKREVLDVKKLTL